ncbi:MAG: hypothetical protein HOW73_21765 [Polyangiaceae bacterium]|nr:hypothetical protein [Polyangiaceae bacterium]
MSSALTPRRAWLVPLHVLGCALIGGASSYVAIYGSLVEAILAVSLFAGTVAFLGSRFGEPRAITATVTALVTILPWFFLAAFDAVNEMVVGEGDGCGTGRLMLAFNAACVSAVSAGLGSLVGYGIVARRKVGFGWYLGGLWMLAALVVGFTLLGLVSRIVRPSPQAYVRSLEQVAVLDVFPERVEAPQPSAADEPVSLKLLENDDITIRREGFADAPSVALFADVFDGVGPRQLWFGQERERLVVRRDRSRGFWMIAFEADPRSDYALCFIEGEPQVRGRVEIADLAGQVEPSAFTLVFGLLASVVVVGALVWLRASRRRLTADYGREPLAATAAVVPTAMLVTAFLAAPLAAALALGMIV